jgi:hypothetical protein
MPVLCREAPPLPDIMNFDFNRFEQQRTAAARAAQQMSARSDFMYNDTYDDGDSDELDSSEEFERECEGGIPHKLRRAVWAFNVKCEEDDTSFQWMKR